MNYTSDDNFLVFGVALIVVILGAVLRRLQAERKKSKMLQSELIASGHKIAELENRTRLLSQDLRKQKLEALRFALNPHTFRNTLNSIQFLARNTLKSVDSLANVFDYMLYDAKQQLVPLDQEANFAKEYLNLYRIRLGQHVKVQDEIDLDAILEEGEKLKVAPMLVAHFIENAFKHGDIESDKAFVSVRLELFNQNELILSVRNRIPAEKKQTRGGLGKAQFEERLKLLYADKYALEYIEKDNVFTSNLKLKLHGS
jgi:two-component system LytT family sensor kinase